MATVRTAEASLGRISVRGSGRGRACARPASAASRSAGQRVRSNRTARQAPKELIAAAHSTCFSMALSNGLPRTTTAHFGSTLAPMSPSSPAPGITGIKLTVTGVVPGITAEQFEAGRARTPS